MHTWKELLRSTGTILPCSFRTGSHSATVSRPPYYRKPHRHHEPKHMLQEEFPNAGDASGAGIRLFDYHKTADIVNQLPTIEEKINFVNPYERPWTRAEKTWRRDWHPALIATRKAWSVPQTPAYYDCLNYYKYITKTRVLEESLDDHYKSLVPPTDRFERVVCEGLNSILNSTRFDSEEERTEAIIALLFDEALLSLAHNIPRLIDYRESYSVQSESFWIRSGFMFLYDEKEIGSNEVFRKLHNTQKFTGDDRRKLGELAFVLRDKLAFQLRSKEQCSPIFNLESEETTKPIFDSEVDVNEDVLFSPKVMNFWPDENPLWQCPGYFVESGETHKYTRVAGKSLHALNERCDYWNAPEEERTAIWDECAKAQAVASLFSNLNAQAHTQGFTQYTDVTRPFTSQLVLTDGQKFVFAIGQLNTIAINIECDGFENNKTNLCQIEATERLYDEIVDGNFFYKTETGLQKGLNPKILSRILQMVMRD